MEADTKTVAFHTLGCKLNFAETSYIARQLTDAGYKKVAFSSPADIYIINTCTVTDAADRKSRHAINRITRNFPGSYIIITGCYAQLKPDEIAGIKGVDLILGTEEKFNIPNYLERIEKHKVPELHYCDSGNHLSFNASFSGNERTRAFLKIQDGCDYHCSYCTIPLARGKSRNQTIEECVRDANTIGERGVREIVLTGVNIGDFGKSTGESFTGLLKALLQETDIERYRISSIEPDLIKPEIIEMIALDKRILPHMHIPLQSGNNKILGAMRRRYKRELFADKVKLIKELVPHAGIGADVIAGFPGETNEDFIDTYNFLEDQNISYLHVFSYSPRKNTIAASMDHQVEPEIKHERSSRLQRLSENKRIAFYRQNTGRMVRVLWESTDRKGRISGFSGNYIRVSAESGQYKKGEISEVKLIKMDENGNFTI